MKIREGVDFNLSEFEKEVKILPYSNVNLGMLDWADQILVATNRRRHTINQQMRTFYGYENELPQEGERIICKRNYWEDVLPNSALVNGTAGIISNITSKNIFFSKIHQSIDAISADFQPFDENDKFQHLIMDKNYFKIEVTSLSDKENYSVARSKDKYYIPKQFTYAYAITAHAAQGSEWENVVVLEESFPFDRVEHARWLYTACTRASNKLVLVRN